MTDSVISKFEIQLDAGPEPIFKGGEVITGKLQIELSRPIVINAVKLQMKGRSVWLNDPMKKDDIEKVLFDNDMTLLERPPGKLEPGHFTWIGNFTYSLPFECPLPKGCPTSYEGPYAYIRYFIRASLVHEEDNGQVHEYYVKQAFSIVSPSDGYLVIGESQSVKDSATFGSCCCKGKLNAELNLPKTGYLPGEAVYGSLKIGNKYPKDILNHMEVRLVDRVRRIGAAEIAAASPWRTLLYRRLEEEENTPKNRKEGIQKENLQLLTIPSVCPTTKGDFDSVTNEVHQLIPNGRLLESPSTATLRFRKQPFLKIEYAIQLTLGVFLLLEVPIDIGEHSTKDHDIKLQHFVAGAQTVEERDESGKIAINGPFTYTPVYPYKDNVTSSVPEPQTYSPAVPTIQEEQTIMNASHSVVEREIQNDSPSEDGKTLVRTVKTVVTHVDGNETKTMEETVVEQDGSFTRTIEETVLSADGIEKHRIEEISIDNEGHQDTKIEEVENVVPEEEIEQRKKEIIEETVELPEHQEASAVITSSEGDQVTVYSEETEDGGAHTIKTTTVTKHSDGSESTIIQEHTTIEGDGDD
ncbi:unnamed protein product [Auanema sp. JU1783]|nr:unnamed protein product [Auanema sp. JU1783]